MADILSCKLFITSNRQSQILAAIQNPVNSELVTQMKDYLDEEFISPEYLEPSKSDKDDKFDESSTSSNSNDFSSESSSNSGFSRGSFSGSGTAGLGENYLENDEVSEGADEFDETGSSSDGENLLDEEVENEKIKESTQVNSSIRIDIPFDAIKGALNSREDCSGVIRVAEKSQEHELWIYYSDDINLNNVMTSAVELLSSSNYSYLEFNRLARSNNAIVFDILKQSVDAFEGDDK